LGDHRESRLTNVTNDETARVWNASSGQLLATLQGHAGFVYSAVFSPDGQRIVTASEDQRAYSVWSHFPKLRGAAIEVKSY